jgi:hypothetical protein
VREKYCWLAGGWWLVLNWCERKTLLAGWQPASRTRPSFERFIETNLMVQSKFNLDFLVYEL